MKPLTASQVEAYLRKHGFVRSRIHGSHHIWTNAARCISVTVPHHGNRPLKQGTLISIFNAAGIEKPAR